MLIRLHTCFTDKQLYCKETPLSLVLEPLVLLFSWVTFTISQFFSFFCNTSVGKKFRDVLPHICREARQSIPDMFLCVLFPFSSNLKWKTLTCSICQIKIHLKKMDLLFSSLQNTFSALISPIKRIPEGRGYQKLLFT